MKKHKFQAATEIERRSFPLELRAEARNDGKPPKLIGHAAVFNRETVLWRGVSELIEPGAFAKTIQEGDARAFWNHNSDIVLGRKSNGTLRLAEDSTGLATEIDPPGTDLVRDMAIAPIERGDVDQMSFGFQVVRHEIEEREDETILFRIKEVKLFEVSPVAIPAYPDTTISARSREAIEEFQQQRQAADTSAPGLAAHPEQSASDPTPTPGADDHPSELAGAPVAAHLDEQRFQRLEIEKRLLQTVA